MPTPPSLSTPRGIATPDSERGMRSVGAPALTVRCSACKSPLSLPDEARVTTERSAASIMVNCASCGNAQRVPVAS